MMTLKPPTPSPICSSKILIFRNYGKASHLFCSSCQSPHVNVFARLFNWCSQSLATSPSTQQQTPFKLYLLEEFDQYLVKSKRAIKCRNKEQVTTKNIKKEGRLCMKSLVPEAFCAKSIFQIQLLLVLTFQIIYQYPKLHDKTFKTS